MVNEMMKRCETLMCENCKHEKSDPVADPCLSCRTLFRQCPASEIPNEVKSCEGCKWELNPLYENKDGICGVLGTVLSMTRQYRDLSKISYEIDGDGSETAVVTFKSGKTEKIDITADSGIAIIKDVLRNLGGL